MSGITVAPVATNVIAQYRAHIASVVAPIGGYVFEQLATMQDRFTKTENGKVVDVIVVDWHSNKMAGFSSFYQSITVQGQEQDKLQKLCRAMGVQVANEELFKSLPKGHPAKLGAKVALMAWAAQNLTTKEPVTPVSLDIAQVEEEAPKPKAPAKPKAPSARAKAQAAKDAAHILEM